MHPAISIIKDEHRSIAAVLQGLQYLITEIRENRMRPDFKLLSAMLRYIEAFPEKLHHPKEDEYLFRFLRLRRADIALVLDELEAQHAEGRTLIDALMQALSRYEQTGAVAFDSFAAAVERYAEFEWGHMRKEDDIVLPAAEHALTVEDWQIVDAAFQANDDPIAGLQVGEFRELFRRIVNLAPPPIGVGPAQSG